MLVNLRITIKISTLEPRNYVGLIWRKISLFQQIDLKSLGIFRTQKC